jgi:hypothetical protein
MLKKLLQVNSTPKSHLRAAKNQILVDMAFLAVELTLLSMLILVTLKLILT